MKWLLGGLCAAAVIVLCLVAVVLYDSQEKPGSWRRWGR